jgi:hypothetical protein
MPNPVHFVLLTPRPLLRKEGENLHLLHKEGENLHLLRKEGENLHLLHKEGENILFSNTRDCFEENCFASLRNFLLAMTLERERDKSVHEQVPNTNIKFICPEFKEKMLYAGA